MFLAARRVSVNVICKATRSLQAALGSATARGEPDRSLYILLHKIQVAIVDTDSNSTKLHG
eukprot:23333-Amphidinium_carterae.2